MVNILIIIPYCLAEEQNFGEIEFGEGTQAHAQSIQMTWVHVHDEIAKFTKTLPLNKLQAIQ